MLSFNTKSRYGLAALLTLAEFHERGRLQLREIAERNAIPPKYLEQIFSQLASADIIKSVRGKNGGYTLARQPGQIYVLEIIEILEGGLALVSEDESQPRAVTELLHKAEDALKKILTLSLAELFQRQQELEGKIMFHI